MRSARSYPESPNSSSRSSAGFGLITALLPEGRSFCACISSRIPTVIHVENNLINYSWFNEPFAVSLYQSLYLDMHGLIFETSIWLLAGSTRYPSHLLGNYCSFTVHYTVQFTTASTLPCNNKMYEQPREQTAREAATAYLGQIIISIQTHFNSIKIY